MEETKITVIAVAKAANEIQAEISTVTFQCCGAIEAWDGATTESYDEAEKQHYFAHPDCFSEE